MTHRIGLVAALYLAACNGCVPTPQPGPTPVPPPVPTVVPDAGARDAEADARRRKPHPVDPCGAQCAHLETLHCPEWSLTCPTDCDRLDVALRGLPGGHAGADHACITAAPTCAAVRKCGAQ